MNSSNFKERWEALKAEEGKIKQAESQIISDMKKVADESQRVAKVAHQSRIILTDLDLKFERCTGLTGLDVKFLFFATALQCIRQYVLTQFPERLDDQTAAKNTPGYVEKHSNRSHRYYNPSLDEIIHNPVPFDANIGANGALAGGGSMGHRVTALGHDPILGWIFGTSNIATSTLTNNRLQSYHIATNINNRDYFRNHADTALVLSKTKDKLLHEGIDGKAIIGQSLIEELRHLRSDIWSKKSLPLPVVSVFNPTLASTLAERGLDMANIVTIGKQATYTVFINSLIAMLHGLFCDDSMDRRLHEVRTRKILSYSNLIASTSNLIYVGANAYMGNETALRSLDIGGLLVTVYRVATDAEFIRRAKEEFIEKEFFDMIRGN